MLLTHQSAGCNYFNFRWLLLEKLNSWVSHIYGHTLFNYFWCMPPRIYKRFSRQACASVPGEVPMQFVRSYLLILYSPGASWRFPKFTSWKYYLEVTVRVFASWKILCSRCCEDTVFTPFFPSKKLL